MQAENEDGDSSFGGFVLGTLRHDVANRSGRLIMDSKTKASKPIIPHLSLAGVAAFWKPGLVLRGKVTQPYKSPVKP